MTVRRKIVGWLLVWAVTIPGLRVTLVGAEQCPAVTAQQAREAVLASADWIANNQSGNGKYLYEWDRSTGEASADYNLVRHAGTTMALYQLVAEGEASYLTAADSGLEWMLNRTVTAETPTGTVTAVVQGQADAKLGTAALMAVSLVKRREATGDTSYDELMLELGHLMESMWLPGGKMTYYWRQSTEAPVAGTTSLFATGEAMWALALLHKQFPDQGWDQLALGTMQYIATDRDDDEDVWPRPWADQWAAYGLNEMAGWGLTDRQVSYAREIAAQFGVATRWESQRNGPIGSIVHGPTPLAAGQGTWLEALGMLQEFATKDPRMADLADPLADRLLCGAGRMVERQVRDTGVPQHDGAWFTDDLSRVDGQQHALSGLLFAERLLLAEEKEDS